MAGCAITPKVDLGPVFSKTTTPGSAMLETGPALLGRSRERSSHQPTGQGFVIQRNETALPLRNSHCIVADKNCSSRPQQEDIKISIRIQKKLVKQLNSNSNHHDFSLFKISKTIKTPVFPKKTSFSPTRKIISNYFGPLISWVSLR